MLFYAFDPNRISSFGEKVKQTKNIAYYDIDYFQVSLKTIFSNLNID